MTWRRTNQRVLFFPPSTFCGHSLLTMRSMAARRSDAEKLLLAFFFFFDNFFLKKATRCNNMSRRMTFATCLSFWFQRRAFL